jgi:hypothetical protein
MRSLAEDPDPEYYRSPTVIYSKYVIKYDVASTKLQGAEDNKPMPQDIESIATIDQ